MEETKLRLVFLFSVFTLIPKLWANIGEFDDFLKQREEEAWKRALAAYEPCPENVTNHLNLHVNKVLERNRVNQTIEFKGVIANSTKRYLRGKHKKNKGGPCMATNPIDRCWRCKKSWAKKRKRLASCVLGFGYKTRGGNKGEYYLVTDSSDDDAINPEPGTLRHAVIQNRPLWIIFARDMHIKLSKELMVQSNMTIDGRGVNVHIAHGCGITIQFVQNVIIHNVHIHHILTCQGGLIRDSEDHFGLRTTADGDGISIFGSSKIWLDHISMSECQDGLIDAIHGSTAITISNCHFTHHDHVILLGGSDTYAKDQYMQITLAFNHFGKELIQRMPRCRWGFFHVVNNDYTHWKMYAIGGSTHPTIISQGNRFIAPDDPRAKEITSRNYAPESEWKNWLWTSEGDLFMNGAFFRTSGPTTPTYPKFKKKQIIKSKPATFVRRLTRFAGTLNCEEGVKC